MKASDLFSILVSLDFMEYSTGVKQVFFERKSEILKELEGMDMVYRVIKEIITEMEKALESNVEYPSRKAKYEAALASIKDKKGWFADWLRKHAEHKMEKDLKKAPKTLDKDTRRFLEEELERKKRSVTAWDSQIRPTILEFLKV